MEEESWFHSYKITVVLETDVDAESLRDLKWWEDLTHTDESPYFLVTEIKSVEKVV